AVAEGVGVVADVYADEGRRDVEPAAFGQLAGGVQVVQGELVAGADHEARLRAEAEVVQAADRVAGREHRQFGRAGVEDVEHSVAEPVAAGGEDRVAAAGDLGVLPRAGQLGGGELRRGRIGQVGDEHAVVVVEQVQVVVGDRQAEQDLVVGVEVVLGL